MNGVLFFQNHCACLDVYVCQLYLLINVRKYFYQFFKKYFHVWLQWHKYCYLKYHENFPMLLQMGNNYMNLSVGLCDHFYL